MKNGVNFMKKVPPGLLGVGLGLGSMMWYAPVLQVFGIAAIVAGVGVSLLLRKRSSTVVQLGIDRVPSQTEVDATLAKYDREMDEFVRRNSRLTS